MGWRAVAFWRARPPSGLLLRHLAAAPAALTAVTAAASGVFVSASDHRCCLLAGVAAASWAPRSHVALCRVSGLPADPRAPLDRRPPCPAPPLAGSHAPPPRDARAPPAAGDKSGLAGGCRAPYLGAGGFPAARGAGQGLVQAGGAAWGQPRSRVSGHTLDTLTHCTDWDPHPHPRSTLRLTDWHTRVHRVTDD